MTEIFPIEWTQGTLPYAISAAILFYAVWTGVDVVYNLYFHPLAHFPGPRLAAASIWWRIWIEAFTEESLTDMMWGMHRKYGPVVRIGPNELHFSEPATYHELYSPTHRWAKDRYLYRTFAQAESSFTILDYKKAKARKDILLPFFSRKSILALQDLVWSHMDTMCTQMSLLHEQDKLVNIYLALRCFALDTITSYSFANSMDALKAPAFHAPLEESMTLSLTMFNLLKSFPLLKLIVTKFPDQLLGILKPSMRGLVEMRGKLKQQVVSVVKDPSLLSASAHPTIYHALLENRSKIPSVESLRDEALLLVFAGTDTVSNTLMVGILNVLENIYVKEKLTRELLSVWPELDRRPNYEKLEELPFLRAVIKESLRLAQGTKSTMTRVVPKDGATLSGISIPGGTVVGMSNFFVHLNEDIFPDAHTFKPERWLTGGGSGESEGLDKWLVAFARGPRSCLGINLAWCELFVGFASLLRRFEFELGSVGTKDLRFREYYLPHYDGPPILVRARSRMS